MPHEWIDKAALRAEICKQLEQELAVIIQAAKSAHEAATHEESKAEDSHDTRGLESSYLAGAQAHRASELQQILHYYRQMEPKSFGPTDKIAVTAVVELESRNRKTLFFIAPQGGGLKITFASQGRQVTVQVITPHSPVGEELIDKRVGDSVEVDSKGMTIEYTIIAIA